MLLYVFATWLCYCTQDIATVKIETCLTLFEECHLYPCMVFIFMITLTCLVLYYF